MAVSNPAQPPPSPPNLTTTILSQPIHHQPQSPLYLLPQELRDIIFAYALLPYTPSSPPPPPPQSRLYPLPPRPQKHNPWNPTRAPYPQNSTYSRPGQRAKMHHPTALLSVSRRTYLETAHLPVSQAAHNFYAPALSGPGDVLDVEAYFLRMTASQRGLVREVRVFANVDWLLEGGLDGLVGCEAVGGVEVLNLVVRWCDWRDWQGNAALSLRGTHPVVQEEEEEEENAEMEPLVMVSSNQSPEQQEQEFFEHVDTLPSPATSSSPTVTKHGDVHAAISSAIAHLPHLASLRLSIEAPYVKASELEDQISDIQTWELRLEGKRASGEGKNVTGGLERRFEWEAPMCAWSDFCAHCGGGTGDDKACVERKRRRMRREGPRVMGAVVRWR